MASFTLVNKQKRSTIAGIRIDAVLNENHVFENEITQWPVEGGAQIIDHVRQLPIQYSLSGVISQTPVEIFGGSDNPLFNTDKTNKVQVQFNEFLKLAGFKTEGSKAVSSNTFQLVDIVTGLRAYNNMAISRISFPRDNNTGKSLRFEIGLIQVEFVNVNFVTLPSVENVNNADPNIKDKAQDKVEAGVQETTDADDGSTFALKLGRAGVKTGKKLVKTFFGGS